MKEVGCLRKFSTAVLMFLLSLLFADAQPGTVDPLFPVTVSGHTVRSVLVEPSDNIVLLGPLSQVNGQSRNAIARLLPEGVLDETFNPSLGSNGIAAAAAIQSDGKWIIAGVFDSVNGVARPCIARLNADGTLDVTFAPALSLAPIPPPPPGPPFPGPTSRPAIELLAIQPDGGVLIGNTYLIKRSDGSELPGKIVRLNPDGSLDENFNVISNVPMRMKVLSDGSLLVAESTYLSMSQGYQSVVWKYHADGSLDSSFQRARLSGFIAALEARDSMIVVGGDFYQVNGLGHQSIAWLRGDGSLDNSFHPDLQGSVQALHFQKNGKLVVTGNFLAPGLKDRTNIVRFNSDGTVDEEFAALAPNAGISALAEQNSGKLVIGGDFSQIDGSNRTHIARLNTDKNDSPGVFTFPARRFKCVESSLAVTIRVQRIQGTVGDVSVDYQTVDGSARSDTDYEPISGTLSFADGESEKRLIIPIRNDSQIEDLEFFQVQLLNPSNGTTLGLVSAATIAILDDDGPASFDPTFRLGPDSLDLNVGAIAVQADGKILIGGYFNRVDWTLRSGIARLNDDGTLDGSFDPGPGVRDHQYPGSVGHIRVQSDQKIVTAGLFTSANGVDRSQMARWNPDGTVDVAFDVAAGAQGDSYGDIRDFFPLNTGKILVAGRFRTFGGFSCSGLVRLNEGGSPDTSYNPYVFGLFLQAVSLDPTSMIAAGERSVYRIDSSGQLDPGFSVEADNYIRDVKILPDGKILLCGWFNHLNGTSARQVGRLNSDGSVDATFNCDLSLFATNGNPPQVYKLALQSDGGILVGLETFSSPRGNYVLRLNSNGEVDADFEPVRFSWPYPGDNELIYDITVQNNGAILVGGGFTLVNGLPRPYLVRLKGTSDGAVRIPAITGISTSSENPVVIDATVAPAKLFVLETSNDLVHWQSLSTNVSMSTSVRLIQSRSGELRAFYRLGTISK